MDIWIKLKSQRYPSVLPKGSKPAGGTMNPVTLGNAYPGYFTALPAKGRYLGVCKVMRLNGIEKGSVCAPVLCVCVRRSNLHEELSPCLQFQVTLTWKDGSADTPITAVMDKSSLFLAHKYFMTVHNEMKA